MASKREDLETDYRRWVRKNWKWWCTCIEYAVGGDDGNPDLVFGEPREWGSKPDRRGIAYWAELKVGETDGVVVQCSEVRPAQVGWHAKAALAGQRTCLLIGVPVYAPRGGGKVTDWLTYAVRNEHIADWKRGFQIGAGGQAFNITAFDTTDFSSTLLGWFRSFT